MAFHFPLEAILRLRRGLESMERLKLEAIASEQAQVKRQLEFITGQFIESRRRFQQRMGQEAFGSELQFEDARSEHVEAVRRALKLRVSELELRRLKQLGVYMKSRQTREILEHLREKKFEVYHQSLGRREQQELDDLFLMRQNILGEEYSLPGS